MSSAPRDPRAQRLTNKRQAHFIDTVSAVPTLDAYQLRKVRRPNDREAQLATLALAGSNETDVLEAGSGSFGAISTRCVLN